MTEPVQLRVDGRRATVTLHRPPLNILDLATLTRLDEALATLEGQDLHLILLRSAAERGFSAGVAVQDHTPDKVEEMLRRIHGVIRRLRNLAPPTLAVVHGVCLGGGLELACGCDLVLATDDARFGVPEVKLGCFPPVAAALFPRRLGRGRALELMLTGRTFDAETALAYGLVTWTTPAARLEARLEELVRQLTDNSAPVARMIKAAAAAGEALPFDDALQRAEEIYLNQLVATEDMQEGLEAFLEKRDPHWNHR